MQQHVLQTFGLTKRYGAQSALDHVDMSIRKGDIYGLIGRNGAGKTTLIRAIAGLIAPDEGDIELFSKEKHRRYPEAETQSRVHH